MKRPLVDVGPKHFDDDPTGVDLPTLIARLNRRFRFRSWRLVSLARGRYMIAIVRVQPRGQT